MRKVLITILLCTILCATAFTTASHGQDKRSKSFLSNFQVGQIVLLSEPGGRYEIRIIKGLEVGHKVLEVGTDYVLLKAENTICLFLKIKVLNFIVFLRMEHFDEVSKRYLLTSLEVIESLTSYEAYLSLLLQQLHLIYLESLQLPDKTPCYPLTSNDRRLAYPW